jgi:hypothetical protein
MRQLARITALLGMTLVPGELSCMGGNCEGAGPNRLLGISLSESDGGDSSIFSSTVTIDGPCPKPYCCHPYDDGGCGDWCSQMLGDVGSSCVVSVHEPNGTVLTKTAVLGMACGYIHAPDMYFP